MLRSLYSVLVLPRWTIVIVRRLVVRYLQIHIQKLVGQDEGC
jgi:hypothetical protein